MMLPSRRAIEIVNVLGLHLRAADKFIRQAKQFQADIRVSHQGRVVNGKSILDRMALAAECGARLELEASGADAEEAIVTLARLVEDSFYETDWGKQTAPIS
jgi:phosphocarrier protein